MTHILHLDASPRGDRSVSRTLSHEFIADWKAAYPDDTIVIPAVCDRRLLDIITVQFRFRI